MPRDKTVTHIKVLAAAREEFMEYGYENAHGRFEYVPIQSMEKNVEILLRLCSIFAGTAV